MRAVAIALVLVTSTTAAYAGDCAKNVGDKLGTIKGEDDNGKSIAVDAEGWKVVTVGAAWCDPCKKEIPAWDGVASDYKGKVTFYSVDNDDNAADGKAFHKQLKVKNMTSVYTKAVSENTMPTTYVVDPKGIIRHERCGFEKGDVGGEVKKLRAALDKLLAK